MLTSGNPVGVCQLNVSAIVMISLKTKMAPAPVIVIVTVLEDVIPMVNVKIVPSSTNFTLMSTILIFVLLVRMIVCTVVDQTPMNVQTVTMAHS
jgi:hypothetical protein